jgi:Tfp pilus assembly protein PilF
MEKAPDLPEIRVNLALAYLRLDRKAEAVVKLEEAVKMAPEEPRILFQLGGAYVEMKDFDKARDAFEKGLEKHPDPNDVLAQEATVTLGAVYFAKGDNDKSIEYFQKALAAKPGAPTPTLGMAKAYLSKGDSAKALELFQQIVTTSPGTPEAAQAEAFISGLKK